MQAVSLVQISDTVAELQWSSNTSNDMIADSALALLLAIDGSPATVKREQCHHVSLLTRQSPPGPIPTPTPTPTPTIPIPTPTVTVKCKPTISHDYACSSRHILGMSRHPGDMSRTETRMSC